MRPRHITALYSGLLVVVSLLVAVGLAEMVLRPMFPPVKVWKYPQEEYRFDPEIGHTLQPNQQVYTHDQPVSINSAGMRDREYSARPAHGVVRILALGDSQTFGNGLAVDDSWPKQLERALNQRSTAGKWEVLNAGIPGTDTWQHEILLQRLVSAYRPDVVVLAIYVNDVTEAFKPRPSGNQITNSAGKRLSYVLRGSVVVSVTHQAISQLRARWSSDSDALLQNAVVNGGQDPQLTVAWKQVDKSLGAMQSYAKAQGIPLLLAVLPRRDMVKSGQGEFAYNAGIRTIAGRYGIPVLDLLKPLQFAFDSHGEALFVPWDGHNSAEANAVVVRELVLLVETRRSGDWRSR